MNDIREAKRLMNLTAPKTDIRIPLIKIALLIGLALAAWSYHVHMTDRIEFLEAVTADMNVRMYQYGLEGGGIR